MGRSFFCQHVVEAESMSAWRRRAVSSDRGEEDVFVRVSHKMATVIWRDE